MMLYDDCSNSEMNDVRSILVVVVLEGAFNVDANVAGLFLAKHGQLGTEMVQVKTGDLLVEMLGKLVHLVLILVAVLVLPKFNLGKGLVAERVGHNKARVSGSAAQVEQTA